MTRRKTTKEAMLAIFERLDLLHRSRRFIAVRNMGSKKVNSVWFAITVRHVTRSVSQELQEKFPFISMRK